MKIFSKEQRLTGSLTALAFSLVTTCVSAGGYIENSPKDLTDSWSGFYFGTYFGAGSGNVNGTENFPIFISTLTRNNLGVLVTPSTARTETNFSVLNGHATGSVAELFVGYNVHKNNSKMIFGGQLEGTIYNDLSIKSSGQTTSIIITQNFVTPNLSTVQNSIADNSTKSDLRSMFSVIGRGGYLINSANLLYGFAGPTEGNFVLPDNIDVTTSVKSKWQLGIAAGGGLEHKINEHWLVRAEYRYIHFNLNTVGTRNSPVTSVTTIGTGNTTFNTSMLSVDTRSSISLNLGKIGIVYQC